MKIIVTILAFVCVSCSTTSKLNHDNIAQQVTAYEDELKALVSMELAMKDYQKGQTSLEMCEYRIDHFMYIRKQSKKNNLKVGLELSQRPKDAEYRQAEKYLLDEIYAWKKKHNIVD